MKAISELLADNEPEPTPILLPAAKITDDSWDVEKTEGGYRIMGKRMERMVQMTDLDNDEAIRYLHRRLARIGVIQKLREHGAQSGDQVMVGDVEFQFEDSE